MVGTADWADRVGGVQCRLVDRLSAHGVCRCAVGSSRAGPMDGEMKGAERGRGQEKGPPSRRRTHEKHKDKVSTYAAGNGRTGAENW